MSCVIIGRALYRAVRQCQNGRTGGGGGRVGGGVHDILEPWDDVQAIAKFVGKADACSRV